MLKLQINHYVQSINVGSDADFETFIADMNSIANFKILTISWKIGGNNICVMLNKKHVRKVKIENAKLAIKFDNNKQHFVDQVTTKSLASKVKRLIMKHDDGWFTI